MKYIFLTYSIFLSTLGIAASLTMDLFVNHSTKALDYSALQNNETYYFKGSINQEYQIVARLEFNEKGVHGTYHHLKYHKQIQLEGNIYGDDLLLDEYVEDQHTGTWIIKNSTLEKWSGIWLDKEEQIHEFILEPIDSSEYKLRDSFYTNFKDLLFVFDKQKLPFCMGEAKEDAEIDAILIQKYFGDVFNPTDLEEYGNVMNYAGDYFETDFGFLLISHHYSTRVANQISNTYIHTFSKIGDPIDRTQLGCNCSEENIKSNDYYSTDLEVSFTQNKIEKKYTSTRETLFEEALAEEDEACIFKQNIDIKTFHIDEQGIIHE